MLALFPSCHRPLQIRSHTQKRVQRSARFMSKSFLTIYMESSSFFGRLSKRAAPHFHSPTRAVSYQFSHLKFGKWKKKFLEGRLTAEICTNFSLWPFFPKPVRSFVLSTWEYLWQFTILHMSLPPPWVA